MFMVCMVVWIGGFLYSADLIQRLIALHQPGKVDGVVGGSRVPGPVSSPHLGSHLLLNDSKQLSPLDSSKAGAVDWGGWTRGLAPPKWCYLLAEYNSSGGCRLAVLPPLRVVSVVPPAAAARLTSPADPPPPPPWNPLADALDPIEFATTSQRDDETDCWRDGGACSAPLLPSTPLELLLVTALCAVSVIVIAYMALALYHCVCSRNYAQWRSSKGWFSDTTQRETQVVLEAMPLVLDNHSQLVEWVTTDGDTIASSCLAGEINVWDSTSGELVAHIDRRRVLSGQMRARCHGENDQIMSDYESGSPPPANDSFIFNRQSYERVYDCEGGLIRRPSLDNNLDLNPERVIPYRREHAHHLSPSQGFDYKPSLRLYYQDEEDLIEEEDLGSLDSLEGDHCPQVWCMDSQDNVIVVGTSTGSIEFWQASSGQFKCMFDDRCCVGVTCLKMVGSRVVLARLTGNMEVLALDWAWHQGQPLYRRMGGGSGVVGGGGHWRCQSAGRAEDYKSHKAGFELRCLRVASVRAHQQPITALTVEQGRILTASHDHTIKVFSLVDQLLVYTLHGHYGPVTHVFIDRDNPMTAGSASQDGVICVWDLLTGACVFSVEGHDGAVSALTYSASYVLSLGSDDRLCVWDRFQGHLLNTIQLSHAYCMNLVMLSHNLLIASKQGSLVIWDVRWGEVVRCVKLGDLDDCHTIRNIIATREGVVCDYGTQLRMVRFPLISTTDKLD